MERGKGLVAPAFQSDDEEFEFWETHDVEDYLTGETVPMGSILRPAAGPGSRDLVAVLRLYEGLDDADPRTLCFGVALPPTEAGRDLRMVIEEELRGLELDHYSVRYVSTVAHAGASPGPVRHLVVEMLLQGDAAVREASDLATQIVNRRPRAKPAPVGRAQSAVRNARRHDAIVTIAKWLRDRDAIQLDKCQADALLRP